MSDTRIADTFQIRGRFLRSIHLEKDFGDRSALKGYVITPQVTAYLERLISGLVAGSGQRAWRITGDYGVGKSSFALALSLLVSGNGNVPEKLRRAINFRRLRVAIPKLLPVLVTASRDSIAKSILQSLHRTLTQADREEMQSQFIERIQNLVDSSDSSTLDSEVIELLQDVAAYLRITGQGTGLLVVLDELGKFLEYAALHPGQQDVYFLQNLAEAAVRSGENTVFVLGLLHQGFSSYADQLSNVSKREWEKVAGRFEELIFDHPLEQKVTLVSEALNVRESRLPEGISEQIEREMSEVLGIGWYGASTTHDYLKSNAVRLFPFHPTVLPVLNRFFSRFAQNERSLFGFLSTNEPFGLMWFADHTLEPNSYFRIHNLYDYARSNFGQRLSIQGHGNHWTQIESVIESFVAEDKVELQILKTVAMLNLLDDSSLLPSESVIELAVAGEEASNREHVRRTISTLQKNKHVLYHRGVAGGLCLWPYTSVNLENAYDEASRAVDSSDGMLSSIREEVETRPLVARRHYIETGNLRHFEVHYCAVEDMQVIVDSESTSADGRILVPLCETEEQRYIALEFTKSESAKTISNLLIAIPSPLSIIAGLVLEVRRWEWIAANVPQLNNDVYAAEEVSRQIAASRQMLQRNVQSFVGLRQFTEEMRLQWFRKAKRVHINGSRELLSYLSDIFDEIYYLAPRIRNELINRRTLSSAAAMARIRLIERMFKYEQEPSLGMDPRKKPPEMSMYLSVLRTSGLHQEAGDGPRMLEPSEEDDECKLRPSLHKIQSILEANEDARVNISLLFDELCMPPYGVREGLLPVLLAAFALIHKHDVAFYENETFLPEISGGDFRRIIKAPESFEVQLCRTDGIRRGLLEKLARNMEAHIPKRSDGRDILDIVIPLSVLSAELSSYTRHTKKLSANALAVRHSLLNAREPAPLIFIDLPEACGFHPFNSENGHELGMAQEFVDALERSLDELRDAYPSLLERMAIAILTAFDVPGPLERARKSITRTAKQMVVGLSDPQFKTFLTRLSDMNLPEVQWLESIGTLTCSKPPSNWTDADEDVFIEQIRRLSLRFRHVESVIFGVTGTENPSAVRLAVTKRDGTELERVVFVDPEEEHTAADIEAVVTDLLKKGQRVGLAAASRAIWKELSQSIEKRDNEDESLR